MDCTPLLQNGAGRVPDPGGTNREAGNGVLGSLPSSQKPHRKLQSHYSINSQGSKKSKGSSKSASSQIPVEAQQGTGSPCPPQLPKSSTSTNGNKSYNARARDGSAQGERGDAHSYCFVLTAPCYRSSQGGVWILVRFPHIFPISSGLASPLPASPAAPGWSQISALRLFVVVSMEPWDGYHSFLSSAPHHTPSLALPSPSSDCCVHCILSCLFCEFLTFCNIVLDCATCGSCSSEDSCICCCCCGSGECADCDLPCDMDCGIVDACCESADCLEICMECCGLCFSS
uniref:MyoD family inhibitor n=1 Tax=Terrapene triunguis TaxID=2587831 RepID=A0A674ILY6_9SAUR